MYMYLDLVVEEIFTEFQLESLDLSSNVVLAAEFTMTSTSFAIVSAKSPSTPRSDSQTFPTTGTSLLNMNA